VRCLIYPVLLLAAAPGCQALHGSRPVAIEARDAETKKPVPGVEVRISYPLETSVLTPPESKGSGGIDGVARLEAAPFGRAGIMMEVKARGYASEVKYLSIQEVQALEPAHWFEDVQRRPASFVVELFAEPGPAIDLIAANLRVKFADGRPISSRAKESALGYWFLKNEGNCYHFFVGTPSDFDSYYRSLQSGEAPRDSGPSEGKGRRGRKGAGDASP
jgi:hypothetical protein